MSKCVCGMVWHGRQMAKLLYIFVHSSEQSWVFFWRLKRRFTYYTGMQKFVNFSYRQDRQDWRPAYLTKMVFFYSFVQKGIKKLSSTFLDNFFPPIWARISVLICIQEKICERSGGKNGYVEQWAILVLCWWWCRMLCSWCAVCFGGGGGGDMIRKTTHKTECQYACILVCMNKKSDAMRHTIILLK